MLAPGLLVVMAVTAATLLAACAAGERELDDDEALAEGKRLVQAGDPAAGFRIFDELHRRHPDVDEPLTYLAWAARSAGRPGDAVPALEARLARGGPAVGPVHHLLAIQLEAADRFEEARAHYEEALRLAPSADVFLGLARLLARAAEVNGGLAVARRGLELFPDDVRLRSWLGDAQLRRRRFEAAEQELELALALPDAGAYPHYSLGIVYLQTGRLAEAREQLEAATALQPQAPEGWYQLANVLGRLGDEEGQARSMARFLETLAASPQAPPPQAPR